MNNLEQAIVEVTYYLDYDGVDEYVAVRYQFLPPQVPIDEYNKVNEENISFADINKGYVSREDMIRNYYGKLYGKDYLYLDDKLHVRIVDVTRPYSVARDRYFPSEVENWLGVLLFSDHDKLDVKDCLDEYAYTAYIDEIHILCGRVFSGYGYDEDFVSLEKYDFTDYSEWWLE